MQTSRHPQIQFQSRALTPMLVSTPGLRLRHSPSSLSSHQTACDPAEIRAGGMRGGGGRCRIQTGRLGAGGCQSSVVVFLKLVAPRCSSL